MSWIESSLVVASVPVVASLATLALTQRFARRSADAERTHALAVAREERLFQAREARYALRQTVVADFLTAANEETDAVVRFEREHAHEGLVPFDLHDDYDFARFNQAYARLAIVVSSSVVEAADGVRTAVYDSFMGEKDAWPAYRDAVTKFHEAARMELHESVPTLG